MAPPASAHTSSNVAPPSASEAASTASPLVAPSSASSPAAVSAGSRAVQASARSPEGSSSSGVSTGPWLVVRTSSTCGRRRPRTRISSRRVVCGSSARSTANRSCVSASASTRPHATASVRPTKIPGVPGSEKPAARPPRQARSATYHGHGSASAKAVSLASSGPPLAVREPARAHPVEPAGAAPTAGASSAARSSPSASRRRARTTSASQSRPCSSASTLGASRASAGVQGSIVLAFSSRSSKGGRKRGERRKALTPPQ